MRVPFAAILLSLLLIFSPESVQAASFSVSTADELIAAIDAANDEVNYPGADTITLTGDILLLDVNHTTPLGPFGLPAITSTLIVEGNGYKIWRNDVDSNAAFDIFDVTVGGNLTLKQLTISGSNGNFGALQNSGVVAIMDSKFLENGTALFNYEGNLTIATTIFDANGITAIRNDLGTVVINTSVISNNTGSGSYGGGIMNMAGEMTITDSTIDNNYAAERGGGIYNYLGTLTILRSTLSNNEAFENGGGGGAIYGLGGTITIVNSTLSNNYAGIGGAIYNTDNLNINYTTFFGNHTPFNMGGDAIYNEKFSDTSALVTLYNSIITKQDSPGEDCVNYGGTYNLFNNRATGNCGNIPVFNLDPVLADHGGDTLTHALLTGSNAIDGGHICGGGLVGGVDQRGMPRDLQCDIGAFEFTGINSTATPSLTPVGTPTAIPTATATPPPATELLVNGSFETASGGIPEGWSGKNLTGDKQKCNQDGKPPVAYNGQCAMQFKGGSGENAKLQQKIAVDDFTFATDDFLTLNLFIKTKGENPAASAKFTVTYNDTSIEKSKVSVDISSTTDYAQIGGARTLLSADIAKIKVQISNQSSGGKIWIDDVSLQVSSSSSLLPLP